MKPVRVFLPAAIAALALLGCVGRRARSGEDDVVVIPTQRGPNVAVAADLLEMFPQARARNAMSVKVQTGERLGDVERDVLYLHPTSQGDATVTYSVSLPILQEGCRLVLTGYTATDPYVFQKEDSYRHNGVRYIIRVDGAVALQRDEKPCSGTAFVIPLDEYAGRTVSIELATNAIKGNPNYDWAHFAEPRVLLLKAAEPDAEGRLPGKAGVALCPSQLCADGKTTLGIQPVDGAGNAVGERLIVPLPPAPGCEWTFASYDAGAVTGAKGVVLAEAPEEIRNALRFSAFTHELKFSELAVGLTEVQPGQAVPVRAVLKNAGLAAWDSSDAEVSFAFGDDRCKVTDLQVVAPGQTTRVEGIVQSGKPGKRTLTARLRDGGSLAAIKSVDVAVCRLPDALGEARKPGLAASAKDGFAALQNDACRMVAVRRGEGDWVGYFQISAGDAWRTVAVAPQLVDLSIGAKQGRADCKVTSIKASASQQRTRGQIEFAFDFAERKGVSAAAVYSLRDGDSLFDVNYRLHAPASTTVVRFGGPSLRVSDRRGGWHKRQALFPGLEYLGPDEPSSSTRDAKPPISNRFVPDVMKITMPLMAVSTEDALVALLWDGAQRWDGEHQGLGAVFASPNTLEQRDNHLMELMLPPPTEFRPENERFGGAGCRVPASGKLSLRCKLLVRPAADVLAAVDAYIEAFSLPLPAKPPRNAQGTYSLSRHGLTRTVWNEEAGKSSHCIGWGPQNAPQFALLLWMDSKLAEDEGARAASRKRAETIIANTLRDDGPGGLESPSCCHIMWASLPFYTGHMRSAFKRLKETADRTIARQKADGSWAFAPDEKRKMLGPPDYASQGIVARKAYTLWRVARLTGYEPAVRAGALALQYHERFSIPHGAQGWECPIFEPDVLGAAYGTAAHLEAYEVTGDRKYLERAVYWARTGICFHYTWQNQGTRPWMLYAGIPVFGTTYYTHSWLGVPVQWCSLVYSYWLQRLSVYDKSYPWMQIAEGITVSGEHQQMDMDDPKDRSGTYPDSLGKHMTVHNGPFINPEDILINRLALEGHDPEVRTRVLHREGGRRIHMTSCARMGQPVIEEARLRVGLSFWPGESSGTAITGVGRPASVQFGSQELREVEELSKHRSGWTYSPASATLFVRCHHRDGSEAALSIRM